MATIKRILCPIDFSEFSRHAIARATAIAEAHGASITAFHVVPLQPQYTPFPLEIVTSAAFQVTPDEREILRRKLLEFARGARPSAVSLDAQVVDALTVHDGIVAQGGRLRADLIVMGTHGRGGFQRLLLGSVTEKVLRTARQPVLTVATADDVRTAGSFKRILCGIDFSECSLAALAYALTLAEGSEAPHVTAVNVVEWTPVGYDPLIGPPTDLVGYRMTAEAAARERLHEAVAKANQKNVRRRRDRDVGETASRASPHRPRTGKRSDRARHPRPESDRSDVLRVDGGARGSPRALPRPDGPGRVRGERGSRVSESLLNPGLIPRGRRWRTRPRRRRRRGRASPDPRPTSDRWSRANVANPTPNNAMSVSIADRIALSATGRRYGARGSAPATTNARNVASSMPGGAGLLFVEALRRARALVRSDPEVVARRPSTAHRRRGLPRRRSARLGR